MKWTTLFQVELTKIRRSKILLLLILPAVILWVPNVMNASLNFQMDDIGISPENSFMIQGFMGLAWFLYPAFLVVLTVLLCVVQSFRNLTFLPIIIANTLIGIFQEVRAKKILDELTMLNVPPRDRDPGRPAPADCRGSAGLR